MVRNSLIARFYSAFQEKDAAGMKACYGINVVFYDPVFRQLDYQSVTAMWEMLLKNGKDLQLTYEIFEETEDFAKAKWIATYTFSRTNRKVINEIHSNFKLENGKIIDHQDHFDFYKWSRQAFGISGWLLGWTSYFRNKVSINARLSLDKYMHNKQIQ